MTSDEALDGPKEWDAVWASQAGQRGGFPNPRLLEAVAGTPPGRAFDLDCGDGANAIWLAGQGWVITGVDFSAEAVARASSTARDRGLDVRFIVADVRDFGPGWEYELVTISYVYLDGPGHYRLLANAA